MAFRRQLGYYVAMSCFVCGDDPQSGICLACGIGLCLSSDTDSEPEDPTSTADLEVEVCLLTETENSVEADSDRTVSTPADCTDPDISSRNVSIVDYTTDEIDKLWTDIGDFNNVETSSEGGGHALDRRQGEVTAVNAEGIVMGPGFTGAWDRGLEECGI